MYQQNLPSRFTTELGSVYTVFPHDVSRQKYDGTTHQGNGKNIYFVSNADADLISTDNDQAVSGRVYVAHGSYILEYSVPRSDGSLRTRTFSNVTRSPAVNLAPVDMVLKADGTFENDHRFHVGDKITAVG